MIVKNGVFLGIIFPLGDSTCVLCVTNVTHARSVRSMAVFFCFDNAHSIVYNTKRMLATPLRSTQLFATLRNPGPSATPANGVA